MIENIVLIFAGMALAILLLGAAFLTHDDCYDPACPCHTNDDLFDDDTDALCEDQCDTLGAHGECSKCGWLDHLAVFNADQSEVK